MTRAPRLFGFGNKRYGKSNEWLLSHKPELLLRVEEREVKEKQRLEEMKQLMKGVKDVKSNLQ